MAKHVKSRVPLPGGPKDAAKKVAAFRGQNEGPTTVGVNPDPPDPALISPNNDLTNDLTSGTPAASTEATSFPPYGGNY